MSLQFLYRSLFVVRSKKIGNSSNMLFEPKFGRLAGVYGMSGSAKQNGHHVRSGPLRTMFSI